MFLLLLSLAVSLACCDGYVTPPEGVSRPAQVERIRGQAHEAPVVVGALVKEALSGRDLPPLTEAYKAYVAERFEGYPDPERAGLWGYRLLRVQVTEVFRDEANMEAGDTVDIYVSSDFPVANPGESIVAFLTPYSRPEQGIVSPHSAQDMAFIPMPDDVPDSFLLEAPAHRHCPGATVNGGDQLVRELEPPSERPVLLDKDGASRFGATWSDVTDPARLLISGTTCDRAVRWVDVASVLRLVD